MAIREIGQLVKEIKCMIKEANGGLEMVIDEVNKSIHEVNTLCASATELKNSLYTDDGVRQCVLF